MLSLNEKISLIQNSSSFNDVPREALPSSHKTDYYFVSYSHLDYKKVLKDILLLESYGINIWYDDEMHIGQNWKEIAELYISKFHCKGVIFYLSENSIKSKACNEEIEYVLKKNKPFFSINIPKDNNKSESGLQMAIRYGFKKDKDKMELFKKAFPSEVLYLSYDDPIEKKVYEISKMIGDDLLSYDVQYNEESYFDDNDDMQTAMIPVARVHTCNDNQILKLRIPSVIYKNEEEMQVERIDTCVFANCTNLEEVELPETLKLIESYAFKNCVTLENINLNYVDRIESSAFEGCKKINIQSLSAALGEYSFFDCESLSSIDLTSYSNTDIPRGCFMNCSNLKYIGTMYNDSFYNGIGQSAFKNCTSLERVNFGYIEDYRDNVSIDTEAFSNCKSLKEIELKGNWQLSGNFIFENCTSLKKVKLNRSIKTLSAGCFLNCTSLEKIIGFKSIRKLDGGSIFQSTKVINTLDFDNISEVYGRAFNGLKRDKLSLKNITKTNGNILEGVEIKELYIGNKAKTIYYEAFSKCPTLEYVEIGEKVFEIGDDAFADNPNLTTIVFNSKKEINFYKRAFVGSPLDNVIVNTLPSLVSVLKQIKQNKYLYVNKNIVLDDYLLPIMEDGMIQDASVLEFINKDYLIYDEDNEYTIYKRR